MRYKLGNPRPERYEATGFEQPKQPGPYDWTPNEAARVDWETRSECSPAKGVMVGNEDMSNGKA